MQEYGGYLSPCIIGENYFSVYDNKYVMELNAARYGIVVAFKNINCSKILLPAYTCETVYAALRDANIATEFYHIDVNREPCVEEIKENECILIINYFGIEDSSFYERMTSKYTNIIFDNTQSFFSNPVLKPNVYNVYSPRKFFPIADGAYVISSDSFKEDKEDFPIDYSGVRMGQLYRAAEEGTNCLYSEICKNEESISKAGIKRMSVATKIALANFDYATIKIMRKNNYNFLVENLREYNELELEKIEDGVYPIAYPLLISSENIRYQLIERKVYVPQWWKWAMNNNLNSTEMNLSKYLLPIPIDQRYTLDDMKQIKEIVIKSIRNIL